MGALNIQDLKTELQSKGQLLRECQQVAGLCGHRGNVRKCARGLAVRPQGLPGLPGSSCPGSSAGWVPTHTRRALHSLKDPISTEDLEKGPSSLRYHYTLSLHLMESPEVIMSMALSGFKSCRKVN